MSSGILNIRLSARLAARVETNLCKILEFYSLFLRKISLLDKKCSPVWQPST